MAEWIDDVAGRALKGDATAWRRLYDIMNPRLWGLFRHFGCAPSEVEDLVQETWTRLIKHSSGYDGNRPFVRYLFSIAYHLWVDYLRKQHRKLDSCPLPEDKPGEIPLPSDAQFALDHDELIHHGLSALSDEERAIIVMRFWHKLTCRAIAGRLGLTESSVRGKAFRALCKLRDALKDKVA